MQQDKSTIQNQYKNWFLDYASYVILERAVPAIEDGLKPVQRRILHAMKEMDDSRFNKVANIIGQSMQYHPHGDASIGDAIVNIGQKDLLIETQGNWGDVRTGDVAAAPRYIEARLSKFALETSFNAKTTSFSLSYDGRKKEPITLPMKFPLLLHQGVEGIAVGLATKILPHNFIELIEASIKYLKNKKFELYPDFITGGNIDVSNYQDGKRGGKVRVRCTIKELDKKTLVISDVPFSVTTAQLIDSITKANDQGKIKIKKVIDITAQNVEIQIDLVPGITTDLTIEALYAFTDCEVSISPNACVIKDNRPQFLTVKELLIEATENTKKLLKKELDIKLAELYEAWHFCSLEKIFFEQKIYQELEKKHEDWTHVLEGILKAFKPYTKLFKRAITTEDVTKLTEKPVRRIYRLDIKQLEDQILKIDEDIKETIYNLENLVEFTIKYYENLQKKYGKGRERKTHIKLFDTVEIKQVAIANTKLYAQKSEGFIGTSLKKDEYILECSDYDDIIAITKEGVLKIVKVQEKIFIGKDIIHIAVFKKNDSRTTYNVVYVDGESGISFAKRFNVVGITREKEYELTKGSAKSKIIYFSANPNGEAEIVKVQLSPACNARIKDFEFNFADIDIKGRGSIGNQVVKFPIKFIRFKEAGKSTLKGIELWFDDKFGRLNTEGKGILLGNFENEKIVVFYKNGNYEITDTELIQRFEPNQVVFIEKFNPENIYAVIYTDMEKELVNVKRFKIESTTHRSLYLCIKEGVDNSILAVTSNPKPIIEISVGRGAQLKNYTFNIASVVDIMGWKAVGVKLIDYTKSIELNWQNNNDSSPNLFD
ncbi:MAG: DNA gyrase/topoisomerase IV subunit A [Alphaproteobacteria bacterium]|nr:DNA gyrase/topoisomerase IV subunit A [Alphaproteobacteria bacterium]